MADAVLGHVGRIVIVQALLGGLCSAGFWWLGPSYGFSGLMALMSAWVPSSYYAWAQSRTYNATRLLLQGVLKTLLTMVLMAVCIVKVGVEPLAYFVTFAAVQLGYLAQVAKPPRVSASSSVSRLE